MEHTCILITVRLASRTGEKMWVSVALPCTNIDVTPLTGPARLEHINVPETGQCGCMESQGRR